MPTLLPTDQADLRKFPLFAPFSSPELAGILIGARTLAYAPSEHLIDKDDDGRDIFVILKGRVRIVDYSYSGREISFDEHGPGALVGELAALCGGARSANVIAVEDTTAIALGPERFIGGFSANGEASRWLFGHLARLVRRSTERIMDLSTLAANNRVQAEILRLARATTAAGTEAETASIRPIPNHSDIAGRVSTTRETVARVLSELARAGLVERQRDRLVVHDVPELETMVRDVRGN